LPADRRPRRRGRSDRRRVPGDRERRVRALLPGEVGRGGVRRCRRRVHAELRSQRRRRHRPALEISGRAGANGARTPDRVRLRSLLAHSSRDRAGPVKRAARSIAKWTAVALGALLVVAIGVVAWGVSTQAGTRSLARIATDVLGGKLALGSVAGTIVGP